MTVVLLLAVLIAVTALANWWSRWRDDDRVEVMTKPTVTILVIALSLAAGGETGPLVFTVAALVFCLVGDIALLPQIDRFIVGLAAFLVGHLAFIAALGAAGWETPVLAIVAAAIVGPLWWFAGRRIVRAATASEGRLGGPVVAYLTVISAMVVIAWGTGLALAIVGATAFIISDTVLGWRAFVAERRWMAVTVMMTYHVALVTLALVPYAATR